MIRASTTPSIFCDLGPDRRGDLVGGLLVLAGDPDADRRRLALVHGRADHAAGVEGELEVAERRVARERRAQDRGRTPGPTSSARPVSWILTTASIGPAFGV